MKHIPLICKIIAIASLLTSGAVDAHEGHHSFAALEFGMAYLIGILL